MVGPSGRKIGQPERKKGKKMWEMDYDRAAEYWTEKDRNSPSMPEDKLREKIEAFIRENNTCALAAASSDMVRCTPIEYIYIDGAFYMFSEGGLKFRCLKENSNVGLAVYRSYEGFGKLKSLQVTGRASVLEPFSEEYLKAMEIRKIPVEQMKKLPHPMNLIKVVPEALDYLDSGLKKEGFEVRQHLEMKSDQA